MAHALDSPPDDDRDRLPADRDRQLADARAAFRRERDADRARLAADRLDLDRLTAEAKVLRAEAARTRDRTKHLAYRYARRVRQKWAAVKADLDARTAALADARGQFTAEVARFKAAESDFHVAAAGEKEGLREGWAALDAQRRRAAVEWGETNDYLARQEGAYVLRAADLTAREQALAGARAKLEKDADGLRREVAGLDARAQHARAAVEELERRRDQLWAELLAARPAAEPPAELAFALDRTTDRDLTQWAAELDARDKRSAQERANLAALKDALDLGTAALTDQRRVVAEQFTMLAAARGEWQEAERRTVAEMEDLARGLRAREEDFDAREVRLARADARRREDAHDLWRLRLRLEAWQSKLALVERRWHAERDARDAEHAKRLAALTHREAAVEETFDRWERARADERERLRAELHLWADDRVRLADAAAAFDRRSAEVLAELMAHASRAMASEDLLAETVADGATTRRFAVLRKRWERVFRKKLEEVEARRAAAAEEATTLDDRYRELHRALADVADREADATNREARADAGVYVDQPMPTETAPAAPSGELEALRAEVERMAAVLIEAGVPDAPDEHLPWAAEEPEANDVLPFAARNRAA